MQESIYNLIPKEKTPPKKVTKLYKSTIPGTIAPTGSTFGTQSLIIPVTNLNGSYIIQQNRFRSESGILGKSKNQKLAPIKHRHMGNNSLDIWAEKGSIHRSVDLGHQHSATKPQIPKLDDKPIMGLKQHKNFIATNAIDVILANPKRKQSEPDWTKKSAYGKVPPYLTQIKDTLKEQFYEEQYRKQLEQQEQDNKLQQMAEDELEQIRQGLKKKYDELNYQYQQQTHCRVFGTIGVKRRKENYEKELIQLEQDIEKLNKKYVFIQH
ncbi:unnamed protein product (macronuclear) [Paramecium tetraurelia]|uniref:Enkurin domain-containing protein n=1 Tax=Paramecium tetraurelia TaxID=5888 RepID=A0CZF5_PARTE|nr:uncharacterized protein GSPATT00011745001 [Paramecium tetraurelia]CAK76172.1 unnamed protein product [Paramecium tetraurelia]|eukprot:XP_001443569.1 hypothetical protein (macronuclear) [Paramecium tetraurelia strain d4-2]